MDLKYNLLATLMQNISKLYAENIEWIKNSPFVPKQLVCKTKLPSFVLGNFHFCHHCEQNKCKVWSAPLSKISAVSDGVFIMYAWVTCTPAVTNFVYYLLPARTSDRWRTHQLFTGALTGGACDIRESASHQLAKRQRAPKWFMSPEEIKIAFNPSLGCGGETSLSFVVSNSQWSRGRERLEFLRVGIKWLNYHTLTGASWRTSRILE
jgi:hypothetical protein